MPDQEADKGFTFVDRRRRGGDDAPSTAPPAPAGRPTTASPHAASRPIPPPSRPQDPGPRPGMPRADLPSFCVMLYSEALVHLGQVPDPVSGQPQPDLEQAQFTVDLLAMIQEKTEGNRTAEETAVLDEILANLRMAYVRASGARRSS